MQGEINKIVFYGIPIQGLRIQQEIALNERKKREELERQKAAELVKKKEQEEKRKKVEEGEKLRQLILKAEQEKRRKLEEERKKRAHEEQLKRLREAESRKQQGGKGYGSGAQGAEGAAEALSKTKEQLAEEKAICLSIRIKPLNLDDISGRDGLKRRADQLWEQILVLETERYDLEERNKRQDYDVCKCDIHRTFLPPIFVSLL